MTTKLVPTEEQDQRMLVEYLELKGIKFTHIPNSTYTKSWKVKNRNKYMGVRPGFPDLVMVIHNRLIFMELKRAKRGRLSKEQEEWIAALLLCGQAVYTCFGFDEAKATVDRLLSIR